MLPDVQRIGLREKLILSGLYLSKFDSIGLKKLGFGNFQEAFNVIGYGLGAKPASIKNYRDEFDPLFSNKRKGWHKRQRRNYCIDVYKKYGDMDLEIFSALLKTFVGYDENESSLTEDNDGKNVGETSFSKRLITGLAAENYFEAIHLKLPEFEGYTLENTTRLGCGYDFRLTHKSDAKYLAVEVKGLQDRTGNLLLSPKEYESAAFLSERFFLFVVKNFCESPMHEIYRDPLNCILKFTRRERIIVQVSWSALIGT